MQLQQKQTLSHKLIITQALRQSLQCLQYSAHELNDYVQEAALSNPLLEVKIADFYDALSIDALSAPSEQETAFRDFPLPRTGSPVDAEFSLDSLSGKEQSFTGYLNEQLGQMQLVDDDMRRLCQYLIGCLDHRGYLDCPLSELSEEIGCSLQELEQALYTVQMLEPIGVGARSLSECLVLQLAQGTDFNRLTLTIAQEGLDLLAHRDFSALSRKLVVSRAEAKRASEIVLALNPIPSRGFSSDDAVYISPDAFVRCEDNKLTLSLNERILPQVSIHADYAQLAEQGEESETRQYAKEKLAEANTLIRNIQLRSGTLLRLLNYLLQEQASFFYGGELRPVTMQQAAEALQISVSTVSRTVQNKYLQFENRVYPLRDFFSIAICSDSGGISVQAIRQRIAFLIANEDKTSPLSDDAIEQLLKKDGISISRRAVAGHRNALNIPFASRRKVIP